MAGYWSWCWMTARSGGRYLLGLLTMAANRLAYCCESRAAARAEPNLGDGTTLVAHDFRFYTEQIHLVVYENLGNVACADLGEYLVDLDHLLVVVGMSSVDHVQQQVRLHGLFERGAKRGNQRVRQAADETDRVRDDGVGLGVERDAARGGIKSREQLVRGVRGSLRERIEERRLAGVRVTHQGDAEDFGPASGPALNMALRTDLVELLAQNLHAVADQSPVGLEL